MSKLIATLICLVLLSACVETAPDTPLASETPPPAIATKTIAPTLTPGPTHTPTPEPLHTSIPTPPPTLEPSHLTEPLIHEQPGPIYETVLQIPVGDEGIQYRGAGVPDMEMVGPNGLVVTPDGVYIIGDVNGNRLMRYDAAGKRQDDIDLTRLGILNVSDLVGTGNTLYILEISFKTQPERYRVNRLTTEGELVSQYDLPKGFHLEDGLYGLAIGYTADGEAQVHVQLGAGADSLYYRLPNSPEGLPEELPALPVYGKDLIQKSARPGELALLGVGEQEFESRMTNGGTIFLLSARADGSMYLQREDLVAWDPVITTDLTIHYISAAGKPIGVARYPLMDWYFHLWRFLTVGPDGNAYAIITREESVDVLRLNFYLQLEPILPDAAKPEITTSHLAPSPDPKYDCSRVQHLPPDSPEAQQIVQEFLANFQQDQPTEYMALDPLWGVDRLGEYAVIQGLITQEASGLIVVQQTQRGYVMVADYLVNVPGSKHSIIPDYFQAKLPEAPPELFYCLDLSRFVGEID